MVVTRRQAGASSPDSMVRVRGDSDGGGGGESANGHQDSITAADGAETSSGTTAAVADAGLRARRASRALDPAEVKSRDGYGGGRKDGDEDSDADTVSLQPQAEQRVASAARRRSRTTSPSPSSSSSLPSAAPPPALPLSHSDLFLRTVSSLFMVAAFVLVVLGGHIWVSIAIIAMEVGMFREILGLGYAVAVGGRIPLWRTTGWYFFASCLFLFYGKSVLAHFEDQGRSFMAHPAMQYALRHHTFISFVLYCAGFVGFVVSLKQGQYQYQFSYFGRALAALVLVVVQSHFMILNVKQGLIWFVLPSALVIVNDSFAYVCGRLFGRHSLTSLSPKKTWEGYIGGGVFTVITALFLSTWLSRYPSLACPKYEFTDCVYYCPRVTCDPLPYAFIPQMLTYHPLPSLLPPLSFTYIPIQLHALALGLFASAIAPFGGFFASGAKRAFNIKDFANLFPGHGGVTDRVDCQLLMAVFTYVYIINFVDPNFTGSPDVGKVMAFVSELSTSEQIQLLNAIQSRLQQKGVVLDTLRTAAEVVHDAG